MNLSHVRVSAFGMFGLAALLVGCSGSDGDPTSIDDPGPRAGESVGEFLVHVQPRLGKVTFRRLSPKAVEAQANHRGPGLSPQVMADVNLQQDDVPGSGPADSVELVTDSVVNTYGTGAQGSCPANSICADVTLNSFWTRTLNNTYVELTSITDSTGQPITGHSGTNSDAVPTTCKNGCPSNSLGLWKYQSPSVDTSHFTNGSTGVVAPGAANGATRTWVLANPDDAETYIWMRVLASTTYTNYSVGFAMPAYMDACTVGAGETQLGIFAPTGGRALTQPAQPNLQANFRAYVKLPFQFTFYGVNYPANTGRVYFSRGGNATFSIGDAGGNALPSISNNSALPTTSPSPAIFPFWDNLAWSSQSPTSTSAGLCAKTIGSAAPNRQVVISWQHVAANGNASTGPFVSFSVVLNEGSEEIWFNYGGTTSGPGSSAWSATIGAQDSGGTTVAAGSTTVSAFPASSRKVLLPLP